MSNSAKGPARFCLLALCVAWANAEENGSNPVIGGVYVAPQLSEDSTRTERAFVWPMAALRVDDRRSDTLLVKYTPFRPSRSPTRTFATTATAIASSRKRDLVFGVFSGWRQEAGDGVRGSLPQVQARRTRPVVLRGRRNARPLCLTVLTYVGQREPEHAQAPLLCGRRLWTVPPLSSSATSPLATWGPPPEPTGCRRVPSAEVDDAPPATLTSRSGPQDGESFRDCAECPEMVVIPGRPVLDGLRVGKGPFSPGEQPSHEVIIARRFALSKYETTFAAKWGRVRGRGRL